MNRSVVRLVGVLILIAAICAVVFEIGEGFLFGFVTGLAFSYGLVVTIYGKFRISN